MAEVLLQNLGSKILKFPQCVFSTQKHIHVFFSKRENISKKTIYCTVSAKYY